MIVGCTVTFHVTRIMILFV